MLIRRHLPNGRSNHGKTAKPLIFKGLTGKCREYDQRLNYRPLYTIYTIYTDIQTVTRSVLENKSSKLKYYSITRKQTETTLTCERFKYNLDCFRLVSLHTDIFEI